jgi:hypothetical protein
MQETNIFVSYSHHDSSYVTNDSLLGFLRGLEHEGAKFWWDQRLIAGDVWDDQIRANLLVADIALTLVSQRFLDSEYIRNVELRSFLERVQAQGLVIVPVILSKCDWQRFGWLNARQHLPPGDKTLAEHYYRRGPRENMFSQIREALRQRLKSKAPAELAIEAMSGAVNLINQIEPEYRTVVSGSTPAAKDHSLRFEGHGNEVCVYKSNALVKKITADTIRHLDAAELETITTLQKAMRAHYERWHNLYNQRSDSTAAHGLRQLATDLKPELLAVIGKLQTYGVDLEDHYWVFYNFVSQVAANA